MRAAALVLCAACATARPAPKPPACDFPRDWVQATLDLWERTTREVLRHPEAPLPHMLYFDDACTFVVAGPAPDGATPLAPLRYRGREVSAFAVVHGGTVHLPDGQSFPPRPHAAGALYKNPEPTPYYAMALLPIWRRELPADKQDEHLSDEFLTIAQHELTHTLQLRGIFAAAQRIAEGGGRSLNLDDDAIQARFEGDPAYVAAYEEEKELLFAASLAADVAEKKRMVRRAVELARARQGRWFVGEHAIHAPLDGMFLSMEGLGEWVRYKLMTAGPVGGLPRHTREQAIARLRGKKPSWSQDEGLAILLVLEQLLPAFRDRLLADDLPDAFALLDEASR
jgi:hypothetical protein